jgi:Family of unknown function (DUF5989)
MNEHDNKTDDRQKKSARPVIKNRRDFFLYAYLRIKQTRKWWLLPVLVLLMIIGIFLNMFTGYNVLPAIYSLIP